MDDVDEIVYLLNEKTNVSDLKKLPKNKLRLALPAVCRRCGMRFKPLINSLVAQGYKKMGNRQLLGAVRFAGERNRFKF